MLKKVKIKPHHHAHGNLVADVRSRSGHNLVVAIVLNLSFSIIEFSLGAIFNSRLILADALHDLGDVLMLIISLFVLKFSKKPPTERHSYGFRRLAVFGAIINATVLLLGSWQLLRWVWFELTFPHKHSFVNVPGLAFVSLFGIVANLVAALKIHGSKNVLDKTVFTHLLEDVLSWFLSFLVAILIWFTGLHQLDQIMTIVILIVVSFNALANAGQIFKVMMNATPSKKDLAAIRQQILAIDGVKGIENIHFWSLDGENHVLTARILVAGAEPRAVRQKVSRILPEYGVVDSTIEILE